MVEQLLPVVSALFGVFIGGVINYFTTRSVKQQEWKLALVKERIFRQEKLFSGFLLCTQRLLMQSIEKKISSPTELNEMNDLFSQIELLATQQVVDAAKQLCDYVMLSHSAEPKEEKRNFYSLKQDFIRVARTEIHCIQNEKNEDNSAH